MQIFSFTVTVIMSMILNFSANESTLVADYFPPIELAGQYECGLISLFTYNSIPNVNEDNNLFHVGDTTIDLPTGSYEVDDIASYIDNELQKQKSSIRVKIIPNTNTLKTEIKATHPIHFDKERTIGRLLGFSSRTLKPDITHHSDLPVNINKVNSIRVECNIIIGTYLNNIPVHTIHEFAPNVLPGYKINEIPKNIIYLPVNTSNIRSVVIKLVDQDGNLIDFRNETVTIRLHLRQSFERSISHINY